MPIKKGKNKATKSTLLKRGKALKQKQSQSQTVIVNINKGVSKSKSKSKGKALEPLFVYSSSSYTTPNYVASSIPYPAYQRQADAVAVSIPSVTPDGLVSGLSNASFGLRKLNKTENEERKKMFKEDVSSELLRFKIDEPQKIETPIKMNAEGTVGEPELIEAQRRKISFFTPYTSEYGESEVEGIPLAEATASTKRKYVKSGKYKKKKPVEE